MLLCAGLHPDNIQLNVVPRHAQWVKFHGGSGRFQQGVDKIIKFRGVSWVDDNKQTLKVPEVDYM